MKITGCGLLVGIICLGVVASQFSKSGKRYPEKIAPIPYTEYPTPPTPEEAVDIPEGTRSEIVQFCQDHPDFGRLLSVKDMPDWAYGERQQVRTTSGEFLFYLEAGGVEYVYKYKSDGINRELVWESPNHPTHDVENKTVEANEDLPAYVVLYQMKGRKNKLSYGDILVEQFSRTTPQVDRERVLRLIFKHEGIAWGTLYSTRAAHEANFNGGFLDGSPGDAIRKGYLGDVDKEGMFTAGEDQWE